MSDTPRTDAAIKAKEAAGIITLNCPVEALARTLERELATLARDLEVQRERSRHLEGELADSARWQEEVRLAIVERLGPSDRPQPPVFADCIRTIADQREKARDQRDAAHREIAAAERASLANYDRYREEKARAHDATAYAEEIAQLAAAFCDAWEADLPDLEQRACQALRAALAKNPAPAEKVDTEGVHNMVDAPGLERPEVRTSVRVFDASERDIHSPFNACMHREYCKTLERRSSPCNTEGGK